MKRFMVLGLFCGFLLGYFQMRLVCGIRSTQASSRNLCRQRSLPSLPRARL